MDKSTTYVPFLFTSGSLSLDPFEDRSFPLHQKNNNNNQKINIDSQRRVWFTWVSCCSTRWTAFFCHHAPLLFIEGLIYSIVSYFSEQWRDGRSQLKSSFIGCAIEKKKHINTVELILTHRAKTARGQKCCQIPQPSSPPRLRSRTSFPQSRRNPRTLPKSKNATSTCTSFRISPRVSNLLSWSSSANWLNRVMSPLSRRTYPVETHSDLLVLMRLVVLKSGAPSEVSQEHSVGSLSTEATAPLLSILDQGVAPRPHNARYLDGSVASSWLYDLQEGCVGWSPTRVSRVRVGR